jgi:hypothetical protein
VPQQDGNQSVAKSRDRQAVENLVMRYRIERAVSWMGKIGLLIFALAVVAAVISFFGPKYLWVAADSRLEPLFYSSDHDRGFWLHQTLPAVEGGAASDRSRLASETSIPPNLAFHL